MKTIHRMIWIFIGAYLLGIIFVLTSGHEIVVTVNGTPYKIGLRGEHK